METRDVMACVPSRLARLLDLLDIASRQAGSALNDLKLHRDARSYRAITLPRKSRKVKEYIVAWSVS
jgi:hypothetical protein